MARKKAAEPPLLDPPPPAEPSKPLDARDLITILLYATADEKRLIRDLMDGKGNPFRYPDDYGPALAELLKSHGAKPAAPTVPLGMA